MRILFLVVLLALAGCDDDIFYADGTPWEPPMPLSPGRILPRDMDERQWSTFATERGIQADRTVKTFTPVWDGFSSDPTGLISYMDFGKIVMMWVEALTTNTSDATVMSFSGLPSEIRPSTARIAVGPLVDNSNIVLGAAFVLDDTVNFTLFEVSGTYIESQPAGIPNFTNSGGKGLPDGWLITYPK